MSNFPHVPEEEKKKKWFLLIEPLMKARSASLVAQKAKLLTAMEKESGWGSWFTVKQSIEFALCHVQNGDAIFSRSKEIKGSSNPDGVIDAMFAEVRAVPYFVLKGFSDIRYLRRDGLDFSAVFNQKVYRVEVAYLEGPSFKTQKELIFEDVSTSEPIYQLEAKKLINRLKSICTDKERQAVKHGGDPSNTVIFVLSDLEEMHEPWLKHDEFQGQHPIQGFITSRKFPTVIFVPCTVYEPHVSALDGAFGQLQAFTWTAFEKFVPKHCVGEDKNVSN